MLVGEVRENPGMLQKGFTKIPGKNTRLSSETSYKYEKQRLSMEVKGENWKKRKAHSAGSRNSSNRDIYRGGYKK